MIPHLHRERPLRPVDRGLLDTDQLDLVQRRADEAFSAALDVEVVRVRQGRQQQQ